MKRFRMIALAAGVLLLSLMAPSVQGAVTLTPLVSFTGASGAYPGANPFSGLVTGPDGNFYGTTSAGGTNNRGTIYQLTSAGAFIPLISFNGTNGATPYATLTPGRDGNLYGTTFAGGISNWGTIFRFTTNSALTSLFSFTGTNNAYLGANPGSPLVQAGDGSFFGTTSFGGSSDSIYYSFSLIGVGCGTVFQLNTNGTVTAPFVFGYTNGADPAGGLVLGKDGNYYGTTLWGGNGISSPRIPGFGTLFRMTPGGTFTNLYLFSGNTDGGFIYAGLVQGRDGNFYGAAYGGGANTYGTLFRMTPDGTFTNLHTFSYFESGSPYGALMQGSDGNFYGTARGSAYTGPGSVFQMTPSGTLTPLASFTGANGSNPDSVLVQGADGNFYGTTAYGGANNLGTIFRLSVPLPPVFETLTVTNGTVSFTWSAVASQTYQVEYSTNLVLTNWSFLGAAFVATNGTITTTDAGAGASPQRFYRVVLYP